jgi:hypothetical protein
MLSAYHTQRETSTGLARDEPCHDFSSHANDALRLIAEAEMAGMLSRAGSSRIASASLRFGLTLKHIP